MERKSKNILLKKYYKNKRILVTGCNGFKGLWLSLVLKSFGAKVFGLGIKNKNYRLSRYLNLQKIIKYKNINITNFKKFKDYVSKINPNIIFHLASESLVSECNTFPRKAFNTNINGLVNLFEILKKIILKKKIILNVITSDKCYEPRNKKKYQENDPLGGHDIYSASKSCQEIISKSYHESYFKFNENLILTTYRAGNVIGGGDFSKNRLFNDLFRILINKKKKINIRNKNSTRPWQYILDCINGYLLTTKYCDENKIAFSNWNFSPGYRSVSVKNLIRFMIKNKYFNKSQIAYSKNFLKETLYLNLNSNKVQKKVKWINHYNLSRAISETVTFYVEINKLKSNRKLLFDSIMKRINTFFT